MTVRSTRGGSLVSTVVPGVGLPLKANWTASILAAFPVRGDLARYRALTAVEHR
jgi:hypothetical protein